MQLKRADVVAGALVLLDADGLDGLTMRKLGVQLGVQAGAIYWHFKNKEALLGAMADQIVARVTDTPLAPGPWDAQLLELGHRMRHALLAHRDGARVVAGTYVTEPNTVRGGETALRILVDAGFPLDRVGWVLTAAQGFVLGHTIEEQAQRAEGDWEERGAALPDTELNRAMQEMIKTNPADRFAYGLELFLDGVRLRLEAANRLTAAQQPEAASPNAAANRLQAASPKAAAPRPKAASPDAAANRLQAAQRPEAAQQ